ncbi:MAG: peptide chain release factor N(5)-glutamine methyltransferase [Planctomycetes bacterium]|nr:peptide chain release factor N(5)-glutamine methyltransferase [Planctomycetota bacterium]
MAGETTQANGEWTIGRLLDWTRQHFQSKGIDDARLCAELLLAKAMGCQKIMLYTRINDPPTDEQRTAFREMVKAAAEHRPIAYVVGRKEFYSLDFTVTPDVLIPRLETELLVEKTLAWCKTNPWESYTLLDIGTGSGCIAVTLCKKLPTISAVATDLSKAALAVAEENAKAHAVTNRVRFAESDLLDLIETVAPASGFDIIVSNPPYVAQADAATLPRNVRDFEPHAALFAGADGLSIYRRLAGSVATRMKPGGTLLLEIGRGQGDAVVEMFVEKAGLTLAGRYKDLAGIERTLQFTMPT